MIEPSPQQPNPEERTLGAVVAAYLRERQDGRRPDRAEYLARFPELASDLGSFFDQYDVFDRIASPFRGTGREIDVRPDGRLDRHHPPAGSMATSRDFGDFELGRVLGSGGMGVVYEARQRSMNRPVALKMIHGGDWASIEDLRRFRNEVETIARLAHPNIVPIFGVGESDGHHYFSMPLMSGGSLADRLDRFKGDQKAAARIMLEIAGAIDHAHRRGIIHRDLKPSNVLLDDAGRPHVSDFGLARTIDEESSLTRTGAILGSPPYMAPEQAAGRSNEVTTSTDVYGLGAIFYAILTGRAPFRGQSQMDVLEQVRRLEPARPRSIDRRINSDLETICLKCLEKEPERRYAGAGALAEDLGRWVDGRTILARRSGPARRLAKWARRHPVVALLSATILAGAPTSFAITYGAYRSSERRRLELDASLYATKIALAEREIFVGNADHAEELLLECPESLRAWEWRLLLQRSRRNPLTLATPGDQALCAAFSPDGRRIAVGNHKSLIRIWDASSGKEISKIGTKTEDFNGLAFSPDGRRLAGSSLRGAVQVWDSESGRSLWDVVDGLGSWSVAFSPDGRSLATSCFDKRVRLWDSGTGREIGDLKGHADRVTGVAFRPDGRQIASSSDDGSLKVWDVETRRELRTIREDAALPLRSVEYSPDGRFLAAGNVVGTVAMWEAATGRELFRRDRHLNEVNDVAFSPDGKLIASAGLDTTVRVSDAGDGREVITLRGHQANVYGVSFSPDGDRLASAGWDARVRVWDARPWVVGSEGRARVFGKTAGVADDVDFGPDGRLIAATGRDQNLTIWDVETGRKVHEEDAGVGSLRSVKFDPSGRYVATAGFGRAISLIDAKTWKHEVTLKGHQRTITNLAFDPSGRYLASGGEDRNLLVWDLSKPVLKSRLYCEQGFITCIGFSPDGKRVAVASGNVIHVLELEDQKPVTKLSVGKGNVTGFDFSPDGRRLVMTGMDRAIVIFRTSDWSQEMLINRPGVDPADVKFSTDGRFLASCGSDRLVQVWDARDGQPLGTLLDCVTPAKRLSFSLDGNHLAAAGGDRSIRIWDLHQEPFNDESKAKGGPGTPETRLP